MLYRILLTLVLFSTTCLAEDIEPTPDWPKLIENDDGKVLAYQPQIEEFSGNLVKVRAAVAVSSADQDDPIYGAVWLKGRVSTDYAMEELENPRGSN